ncbi:MAG: DUF2780 domain-containing protein [Planctomycetota bacterium]
MDELIKSVVGELGLEEGVTRNATGSLFGFIKEGMGGDFSQIADKLPGIDDLISGASEATTGDGGGGILGGLAEAAGSILGGSAGEGLELAGILEKLGLSTEQIGSLVTMVINFIKENLGDSVIDMILDKVPALKPFLA